MHLNSSTTAEMEAFFEEVNAALSRPWRWQADVIASTRSAFAEMEEIAPDIHEDLSAWNEFYRERVTEAWYLKELVTLARSVEVAVEKGEMWGAVEDAMRMGDLYAEVRLKFGTDWERAALSGRKSIDGSSNGGAKRAAAYKNHHDSIRADYAERLSRTGDGQRAKNATARQFHISRRHLNRILAQ